MDPKLAEVYQTNKPDETDVEALATAELASKLAAADEVNVDGMSDEEAEALASEIIGTNSEEEKGDEAQEEEEGEEEEKTAGEETDENLTPAQEKIAEADYLGRVMAHAYVQERKEIEKQAAMSPRAAAKVTKAGMLARHHRGKVMAAVGGSAGVAAGRASKKEKKGSAEGENLSALDQLALARAHEILKASGIDPNAETQTETEKKSSIDEEKAALLAQKVEERAASMLEQAGYVFKEEAAEEDKK